MIDLERSDRPGVSRRWRPCRRDETPGWQSGPVQRWNGLDEVPSGLGPSAVTIGNFDGVHRGHQAVLGQLVERARAAGLGPSR